MSTQPMPQQLPGLPPASPQDWLCVLALQVTSRHWPLPQVCPLRQACPQKPQFCGSASTFVQPPPAQHKNPGPPSKLQYPT